MTKKKRIRWRQTRATDWPAVSWSRSGSVSVVYLVTLGKDQRVLKIARDIKYNQRLIDEFEILKQLKDLQFREVVKPFNLHYFEDLVGFTMESAGDDTLARWIKRDGRLDLTLLQRFGDDLLRTVQDLDEHGIAHRDIKPGERKGVASIQNTKFLLRKRDSALLYNTYLFCSLL
jgi:serine/threonine protein kinase